MIDPLTTLGPHYNQRYVFIVSLLQNFLIWNTGNDSGFIIGEIHYHGIAEFLHHFFGALCYLLLQRVERNMRDIKTTQIDRFLDNMDNRSAKQIFRKCKKSNSISD